MKPRDTGADPLPDGTFRMIPSGEIVSKEERNRRLPPRLDPVPAGVFGRSWADIERMQGGKIRIK